MMLRSLKKLWRYTKVCRAAFLGGSLIIAVQYFCINYITAWLTREITDAAVRGDIALLWQALLRLGAVVIPFLAIGALGKYLQATSNRRIGNALRQEAYGAMLHAPLWRLEQLGASRAQVLSRLNQDMEVVEGIYRGSLLSPVIFGFAGVAAFISVWLVHPAMALFLLALGGASFGLQTVLSRKKQRLAAAMQRRLASLLTVAGECLSLRDALRQMGCPGGLAAHARRREEDYLRTGGQDARVQSLADVVISGSALMQYVGVVVLSTFLLRAGQIEIPQILYVLQLSGMIVTAFNLVGSTLIALRGALPAMDRVEELLRLPAENLAEGEEGSEPGAVDDVTALHPALCFSPEKKLTLGKAFTLPAGQTTALRGASGCGKTSFLKALMGFYPYEGAITWRGKPLARYAKRFLRREMGYVSQQQILMAGTVMDNLCLGSGGAVTPQALERALQASTCDRWLPELPLGLDTPLAEGAPSLSGGQRQMLCLARALVQGKSMLLLDESFSAIEKGRSVEILRNIRRMYPDKTMVLVSHEEEIARACDRQIDLTPAPARPC